MGGGRAGPSGPMIAGGRGGFFRTLGRAAAGSAPGAGTPTGSASRTFGSSSSSSTTTTTSPRASSAEKPNLSRSLSLSLDSPSIPIYPFPSSYPLYDDDFEWVSEDESGEEDGTPDGFPDDSVLGLVPTSDEVQDAVSALKQVSRVRPELDWKEPSLHLCNPRTLQTSGYDRVYDAFHLLQTDPSVQRMVISLSSDRAVWDAVLKNEVVSELRRAFHSDVAARNGRLSSNKNSNNSNLASEFVRWIFNGTKARAFSIIEKISKLANQLFPSPGHEKEAEASDPFDRLVTRSYMLCVMVFLVVVVARTQKS